MESKTFDLAALDTTAACDKGTEIELLHPVTQEPLGMYVTVLGKDSTVFKDYMRTVINDKLRREAMAKKRGKEPDVPTYENAESEGVDLLVVCTVGWRNVILGGKELEFNVANARKLYTDYSWIRKQIDEGIANLENFMQN